jgi:hypothetical protein
MRAFLYKRIHKYECFKINFEASKTHLKLISRNMEKMNIQYKNRKTYLTLIELVDIQNIKVTPMSDAMRFCG